MKRLDEIEQRVKKTSEGPWRMGHQIESPACSDGGDIDANDGCNVGEANFMRDWSFIVAARQDVPDLVEALRSAIETLEQVTLCPWGEGGDYYAEIGLLKIKEILHEQE